MPEIVTDKNGGRSSKIDVRYDLLPTEVLDLVATIFCAGAQSHGEDNWRLMEPADVYNHLMNHLVLWKMGDTSEDHLGNVACRALMLCWLVKFKASTESVAGAVQDAMYFLGEGDPKQALQVLRAATR